jgi:hypothetical protein
MEKNMTSFKLLIRLTNFNELLIIQKICVYNI